MSNYVSIMRTNYFQVTDEEKFRSIINACVADDKIEIFEDTHGADTKVFGFGCMGQVHGLKVKKCEKDDGEDNYAKLLKALQPDGVEDFDEFLKALQSVVADGDAIIVMETGHEKLRYVVGEATIITRDAIRRTILRNVAVEIAGEMLNNPDFDSRTEH